MPTKTWKQPTERSSLLDEKVKASSYERDERELGYDKTCLEIGESYIFKFLSLTEDDTVWADQILAKIRKRDGSMLPYAMAIPDPGAEAASTILDDEGVLLCDREQEGHWYVPVWFIGKIDNKGVIDEDSPDLMYINLRPSLQKALKALQNNVQDGYSFDSIPNYAVKLSVSLGDNGKRRYSLQPLIKRVVTDGKKTTTTDDPMWGVEDLEAAVGKDAADYIADNIVGMMDDVRSEVEKSAKPDAVKKRFARYRNQEQAADAGSTSKRTPGGFRAKTNPQTVEIEDEDPGEASEEETPAEEEKPKSGYPGLGKGSGRFGKR
jgi:hypothetical protein